MSLPAVTVRTTPTGYKLPEGFKVTIAFSLNAAINLFETEAEPAGFEVPEINITTQHNVRFVTKWPSALIMNDDITGSAGYDPDVMDNIVSLIGFVIVGGTASCVTIRMPDSTTHNYFAFLKSVKFQPLRVAQFPLVNYAVSVTNWDPVGKVEQGVYTVQAGGT